MYRKKLSRGKTKKTTETKKRKRKKIPEGLKVNNSKSLYRVQRYSSSNQSERLH